MMILTLCTMLLTMVTMESRKTHDERSETGECTDKDRNVSQSKDFAWSNFEKFGTCSLDCVNHCICLVQLSVSMNTYFHSEEDVDSGNICRKKMCGFVSESEENTMQGPKDYKAISRKRGPCHVCSRSRDVKAQFVCKGCGHYVCI